MRASQPTDCQHLDQPILWFFARPVLLSALLCLTGCNGAQKLLTGGDQNAPWQQPRTAETRLPPSTPPMIRPVAMTTCLTCPIWQESSSAGGKEPSKKTPRPRTIFEAFHAYLRCLHSPPPPSRSSDEE